MKKIFFVVLLLLSPIGEAKECYTVDFENISISNALKIYSDMTKQNYVLDKKLSGDIQLNLKCVSAKTILDSITFLVGGVVEKKGNIHFILPASDVRLSDIHKVIKLYNSKSAQVVELLAAPNDVKDKLNNLRIKSQDDTNSLLLSGSKSTIEKILPVIAALDVPRKQFMIHARLVSADSSFVEKLGITLKAAVGSADSVLASAASTFAAAMTGGGSLVFQKAAGVILSAELQAAQNEGVVNLLSEPRTVAYEGQPSSIMQGSRIPYQTTTANNGTNTQFIDAALQLTVTPRLGDDKGRLILDLVFTKNSPGVETVGGVSIDTRELKTTVALNVGDTLMLGGIDETLSSSADGGIPVLHDLPGIGLLFGNSSFNHSDKKLLLFITTEDF